MITLAVPLGNGLGSCSTALINPGARSSATNSGLDQSCVSVAAAMTTSVPPLTILPTSLERRIWFEDISLELKNSVGEAGSIVVRVGLGGQLGAASSGEYLPFVLHELWVLLQVGPS